MRQVEHKFGCTMEGQAEFGTVADLDFIRRETRKKGIILLIHQIRVILSALRISYIDSKFSSISALPETFTVAVKMEVQFDGKYNII